MAPIYVRYNQSFKTKRKKKKETKKEECYYDLQIVYNKYNKLDEIHLFIYII